jgi:hypothetical protein
MNTFKTGYYQADTQNGITFIDDILDDENQEVTTARIFSDSLSTLGDDEIMVTFFDIDTFDILEEIAQDYSIN